MKDYVDIGPSPADEACQQFGTPSYDPVACKKEMRAFIGQLRRQFGDEPDGARLAIKYSQHDFGSYPDVVCWYDDEKPESVSYAYRCESECPGEWDYAAKRELGIIPTYTVILYTDEKSTGLFGVFSSRRIAFKALEIQVGHPIVEFEAAQVKGLHGWYKIINEPVAVDELPDGTIVTE